jgi:hypothetical protein
MNEDNSIMESPKLVADSYFSEELFKHSVLHDLKSQPKWVEDAPLAQGARRGNKQEFYFDLRSEAFLPLGFNHPRCLKVEAQEKYAPEKSYSSTELPALIFSPALCEVCPWLKTKKWFVFEKLSTLSAHFSEIFLYQSERFESFSSPSILIENAILKTHQGWVGFSTPPPEYWIVTLPNDCFFLCTEKSVDLSDLNLQQPRSQALAEHLKLFFDPAFLGLQGRLSELHQQLQAELKKCPLQRWNLQGLVLKKKFPHLKSEMPQKKLQGGVHFSLTKDYEVSAALPIAVTKSDINAIMSQLVHFESQLSQD